MLFMCSTKRRVMKPRIPKPTPTAHFLIMLLSVLIHSRGPEVEFCLCFLVVLCWLVGSRGWIIFFELCVAVGPRFFRPKVQLRNFRESFTLLAKRSTINIRNFPKSLMLLGNHNTGSLDVKIDLFGIQGRPSWLKKCQFQRLNFLIRSFLT